MSESEGLVRLNENEREAIKQVLATTQSFDVVHGFRLAALLHKGRVKAAEMAGIMHELFRDSIDDAGRVINDGDLERGRSLALRNFVDGDVNAADRASTYGNIDELWKAHKRIVSEGGASDFVPLSIESASDMSDSDVSMFTGVLSASLDVLLNEKGMRIGFKREPAASPPTTA